MPPVVLQVPNFTLEDLGDDGKRVLLLLDNDWHRDVTLEILQLVTTIPDISDWLDDDTVEDIAAIPTNQVELKAWKRTFKAAWVTLARNLPSAMADVGCFSPFLAVGAGYFHIGTFLAHVRDAVALAKVSQASEARELINQANPPPGNELTLSQRDRPRRVDEPAEAVDEGDHRGKRRSASIQNRQPPQQRTSFAPDVAGPSASPSVTPLRSAMRPARALSPAVSPPRSPTARSPMAPPPALSLGVAPPMARSPAARSPTARLATPAHLSATRSPAVARSVSSTRGAWGVSAAGRPLPVGNPAPAPAPTPAPATVSSAASPSAGPLAPARAIAARPLSTTSPGHSSVASPLAGPPVAGRVPAARPRSTAPPPSVAPSADRSPDRSAGPSAAGRAPAARPRSTASPPPVAPPAGPSAAALALAARPRAAASPPPVAGPSTRPAVATRVPAAPPSPAIPTASVAAAPARLPLQAPRDISEWPIPEVLQSVQPDELANYIRATYRRDGICALCGISMDEGGHRTTECTATHLAYAPDIAVIAKCIRPSRLEVNAEAHCFTFNVYDSCRGCRLVHQCTLCRGDHTAILCPIGREAHVRYDVEVIFRQRQVDFEEARVERLRQSRVIEGEPGYWRVSVQPERERGEEPDSIYPQPTPGLTITRDVPEFAWTREIADRDEAEELGVQLQQLLAKINENLPPPPDHTKVFRHHPMLLLPEGVVNHISAFSFLEAAPNHLQERLRLHMLALQHTPGIPEFELAKRDDDQMLLRFNDSIRRIERDVIADRARGYKTAHFHQAVKHPRQTADGSLSAAPVHILLNFPSLHDDRMVLTQRAFSTALLRKYKLSPPQKKKASWQGQLNLAVWNRIPIKSDAADSTGVRCKLLEGETSTKPYPKECRDAYDTHRADFYLSCLRKGQTKTVLALGSGQETFFNALMLKNDQLHQPAEVDRWSWKTKSLVDDEFGGCTPRTVMLREDLQLQTTPVRIGQDNEPFPNQTLARTTYIADHASRATVSVECIALSTPIAVLVFIRAIHPEVTQTPNMTGAVAAKVQAFDYAVNLVARLAMGWAIARVDPHRPPAPGTFFGSRVKVLRTLDRRSNRESQVSGMRLLKGLISLSAAEMLLRELKGYQDNVRMPGGVGRLVIFEHLPSEVHAYVTRSSVRSAEAAGTMVYWGHEHDLVHRAYKAVQSIRGTISGEQPRTAAQDEARMAANDARRTRTREAVGDDAFDCICACGLASTSWVDTNTGHPTAKYVEITETGAHPPNSDRTHGECMIGIPVDETQRGNMLVRTHKGVAKPTGPQRTIISQAFNRFTNGHLPTEASDEVLVEHRKQREEQKAEGRRKRAAALQGAVGEGQAGPST